MSSTSVTNVTPEKHQPKMGEFIIERVAEDWETWKVHHGDRCIMTLNRQQARAAMLGKYEPGELLQGRLVPVNGHGESKVDE